jgi:CelD/BcsL family acetyltransferase involved in cellulose biosynthesis
MRKFAAHAAGKERIVCYQNASELDTLFKDAEEVARKTYQRGLGAGFATTADVRQRIELAARQGWLRAYVLYIAERPCSLWIGMHYRDSFVSEYLGYDPELRRLGPGMFLIMHVIGDLCEKKGGQAVKELDFGLGHAEYKGALGTTSWLEAGIFIFSPTFKGLTLKVMRTVARAADASARRLLSDTTTFSRLKRAWRDHLASRAPAKATRVNPKAGRAENAVNS